MTSAIGGIRSYRNAPAGVLGVLYATCIAPSASDLRAMAAMFDTVAPAVTRTQQPGAMSSRDVGERMAELADKSIRTKLLRIGTSAGGRPIEALFIGEFSMSSVKFGRPVTFLLVGTQHGTEPAGGEALLQFAEELVRNSGDSRCLLPRNWDGPLGARYILIPNLNPDGRDTNSRRNAAGCNVSTDFVLLSQPETRAVVKLLREWNPDVVLDVHESAEWKRKSLGTHGYLIDFDAQFESANHPCIDAEIQRLASGKILPAVITCTQASGLPAQHYIGEITRLDQDVVHGGLSLRNLRNYAGMRGAVSFLLENRMDAAFGSYETPRNIQQRIWRQHLSICCFIKTCLDHCQPIRTVVDRARNCETVRSQPLFGDAAYTSAPDKREIDIRLRRIDSRQTELHRFVYRGQITALKPFSMVKLYLITDQSGDVSTLLSHHGIDRSIAAGTMIVSTRQSGGLQIGRLAAMLLDPDSSSSIWRAPASPFSISDTPPVHRATANSVTPALRQD